MPTGTVKLVNAGKGGGAVAPVAKGRKGDEADDVMGTI